MRFGLSVLGTMPPQRFIELVRLAEQAGFSDLWVADIVLKARDVFCYLTLAASGTSRIRLGPGVLNLQSRHFAVAVNAMRTLEEIAPGRTQLGVSTGGVGIRELAAEPAGMKSLGEAVASARRLLNRETVTSRTPEAPLDGARLRFADPASIPIFLAATGPRMLRLTGGIADGALFHVGAAPANVRFALDRIREGIATRPSMEESFAASLYAYCSISTQPSDWMSECRSGVAAFLGRHGEYAEMAGSGLRLPAGRGREVTPAIEAALDTDAIRRLAITGSPAECVEQIGRLAEAGLTSITLAVTGREADIIEACGTDVIPAFS